MKTLVESERDVYESMWTVEDYAKTSPGEQLVPAFLDMSGAIPAGASFFPALAKRFKTAVPNESVLDAGCGSGKGAVALSGLGFDVHLCDLTGEGLTEAARALPFRSACLWEPIEPQMGRTFDWVYCCDVLEHIPTPFAMLVISRLLEVARKGVFLSIAMQGDNFGVWAGRPLHLTVQNFVAWRDQLSALARVKECRDMLMNGIYMLEHR